MMGLRTNAMHEPQNHSLMPRAVASHREGKLDEAARLYREILCELPRDFDATHLLGVVALQQGQIDAARRLFHTALGINPHDASAMTNLGTSYLRDGQPELALQWFELALRSQPDSSVAMTNVGTALRKPQEAAECFEAATRAEPDNAEGWANLSAALNTVCEPERARESAVKVLALHPRGSTRIQNACPRKPPQTPVFGLSAQDSTPPHQILRQPRPPSANSAAAVPRPAQALGCLRSDLRREGADPFGPDLRSKIRRVI